MSGTVSLRQVIDRMVEDGMLAGTRVEQAAAFADRLQDVQPWYVRAMVGLGAWLASLLLIGFVVGISLATGGVALVGAGLIAGAVVLRRQSGNDFAVQSVLAASLAGQALLGYGLAEVHVSPSEMVRMFCIVVLLANVLLFWILPDHIHRMLSLLLATAALVTLLYNLEYNVLVPLLGPLLATALIVLHQYHDRLVTAGHGRLLRPLENGLMLSAFGCLLLSCVYLMPELGSFDFYPYPWISTLPLGALFLYLGIGILPPALRGTSATARLLVWALLPVIVAAAWNAPGLLLALVVLLLGAASGDRFFVGAGIAFFALFVAAWFHGIQVTMLAKSISLISTGAVLLLARWLLLRQPGHATGDGRHA